MMNEKRFHFLVACGGVCKGLSMGHVGGVDVNLLL